MQRVNDKENKRNSEDTNNKDNMLNSDDPKYEFEYFINPAYKDKLDGKRMEVEEKVKKQYSFTKDMLKNPNNTQFLYELLWNSGADPCEEVIIYCKLKQTERNCTELFHIMPTSIGPCCVFNMKVDTFKPSPFKEVRFHYNILTLWVS